MSVDVMAVYNGCGFKSHKTLDTLVEFQWWSVISLENENSYGKGHYTFHACPKCRKEFEERIIVWLSTHKPKGEH